MQPNYQQYNPAQYGQPTPYNPAQYNPQQYGPQQYGQPAAAPQIPPMANNLPGGDFQDPSVGGGEPEPRIRHMVGRTLIIEPLRIDENALGYPKPDGTRDRVPVLYANVTIVDGGPVHFGNEVKAGREIKPNNRVVNTPYRITNTMINPTWVVNACRDVLVTNGGSGLTMGVIEIGDQGNNPFLLTRINEFVNGTERPDGAQRRAAAQAVWAQIKAGAFVNPTPTLLTPVAGSAHQQSQQQPSAQYGGPVQPGYVPTPYGQAPISAVHPEYAAAVAPPGAQAYAPVMSTATGRPVVHQQQVPLPPADLPPGLDINQVPPGWDAAMWANVATTPEAKAAIWRGIIASGQQQPPAAPQQGQPVTYNGNPPW